MSRARKVFGRDGYFKRARNANDLDARHLGAPQFRLGGPQHRVHVTRVVARRDNGKISTAQLNFFMSNLAKHHREFNHEWTQMNMNNLGAVAKTQPGRVGILPTQI